MAAPTNGQRDAAASVHGPTFTNEIVAGSGRTTIALGGSPVTRATSLVMAVAFALASTVTTAAVAVTATRCTPGSSATARSVCWKLTVRFGRSCASGCGNCGIQALRETISALNRKSLGLAAQRSSRLAHHCIDRFDATTALTVKSSRCYASAVDPWLHAGQLTLRANRAKVVSWGLTVALAAHSRRGCARLTVTDGWALRSP